MNGYVTKEEQSKLKKHFYRSHLSQLSEDGLRDWLTYRKCLPTDVEKYLPRFKEAEVNGLSLWEYAVKRPGLLKDELGIDNVNVRRTLVQATRIPHPKLYNHPSTRRPSVHDPSKPNLEASSLEPIPQPPTLVPQKGSRRPPNRPAAVGWEIDGLEYL